MTLLPISDQQLEDYLADELTPAKRSRVEKALHKSTALRQRLENIRQEVEMIEAVRDSQALRPPESQERELINRVTHQLDSTLREGNSRTGVPSAK